MRLRSKKYLLPVALFLVGTLVGGILVTSAKLPISTKIASLVKIQASPSPLLTPSPSPELAPSERALKAASFLVVRGSEANKKKSKKDFGDENMPDSELIKIVALKYDADLAKLAEKEALVQKTIAQESQPVVNVEAPQVTQQAPSYPKHCSSSNIGQFTYTDCY